MLLCIVCGLHGRVETRKGMKDVELSAMFSEPTFGLQEEGEKIDVATGASDIRLAFEQSIFLLVWISMRQTDHESAGVCKRIQSVCKRTRPVIVLTRTVRRPEKDSELFLVSHGRLLQWFATKPPPIGRYALTIRVDLVSIPIPKRQARLVRGFHLQGPS